MTSPLQPSSTEIPSSVMEDAVGDTDTGTDVIAAVTNHAAVEALTEEIDVEASRTAASAATDEEKEEDKKKKKKRVTGEKRTRRVGIPSPRKYAKLEDPSQAGRDIDDTYKVQSKHDEKWNRMLEALVEYKKEHNSTMVPQCYDQDQRLGRWVHYQRVEYWIYQTSGKGKINADRIARLEALGFEWDPQRAQWNIMFEKLQEFAKENDHCRVPKGYVKDPELANWVRNQRLEYANLQRNKKTRMTADRVDRLNEMGFKWSTAVPIRRSMAGAIVNEAAVMLHNTHRPAGPSLASAYSSPPSPYRPSVATTAVAAVRGKTIRMKSETTKPVHADNGGAVAVAVAPKTKNEDGEEPVVMSV